MELQKLQNSIYEIRGIKVILDFDLAAMYGVETRVLNQAVSRNLSRFPEDFMFRLTDNEWDTLSSHSMSSQIVMTSSSRRPKTALPYGFSEQGIAMLSSVLRSAKAVQMNILIMRTFVLIRHYALSHKDLSLKLEEHEGKFIEVYEAMNYLLNKDKLEQDQRERKRIGYLK